MPSICSAYQHGSRVDIAPDTLPAYLAHNHNGFVWVTVDAQDEDALISCADQFNLHELAVEDARKGHQRPKIEEYGETLFVVLHTLEKAAPHWNQPFTRGQISLFASTRYVLVVTHNTHYDMESVRQRCETNPELLSLGAGYLLYTIIDTIVDSYFPVVENLEEELENLDDNIFLNNQTRNNLKAFYTCKQKLLAAKHAIAPLMEAMARLSGGRVPPLCTQLTDYYRDVTDHLLRLNTILDNAREMLQTTLQVGLTMIGLAEGENTKKLAAWAAMIALPTMIAGFYGMNFDVLPGQHLPPAWIVFIIAIVIIDGVLFWQFKKSGWL